MLSNTTPKYETVDLEVCTDCLMLMANGGMGDVTEEEEAAHCEAMEARWPMAEGWHVVSGSCDEECGFSWRSCESCGSHLGGDRYWAHAMREVS
jgi:hypothetical protein